jgi:DNA topoisomerase-1
MLGRDPETEAPIYLKTGRFGPYFQVGEDPPPKSKEKPRRASLWPGMTMDHVTLEDAILTLEFPKVLGKHPETGNDVTAQDGPNGPYVKSGAESRSIEGGHAEMAELDLEGALKILAEPRKFGRRGPSQSVLKDLGEHPDSKARVTIRSGRFGPYVTDGTVNASVPKGRDPNALEMDDAIELLAAREEKMRAEGKDPRAKKPAAARKPPTRRRTTTRKSPRRSA